MDVTDEVGRILLENKIKYMESKPWWKSKQIWLAVGQGVVGVMVAALAADPALKLTALGAIMKSFVDIYLRLGSTTTIAS